MIYTVTFNPSLDYVVRLPAFRLEQVNRAEEEALYPGGKGINVSIVLNNLGFESVALGFRAGFTGDAVERMVQNAGCQTDFIPVEEGFSRINVKLRAGGESEINGQGPRISAEALEELFRRLDALGEGDILVLAGSIPNTLPEDIYERILMQLEGRGVLAVVDATRVLLLNVLKYRPFLIKPNHHELGELFGVTLEEEEEIFRYAEYLREMGARNVLVSRGKKGAVFLGENGERIASQPPDGKVVNSVGSGDSMVAGFIAGYLEKQDFQYAVDLGLCAGSASAFQEWLAAREDIMNLMKERKQPHAHN